MGGDSKRRSDMYVVQLRMESGSAFCFVTLKYSVELSKEKDFNLNISTSASQSILTRTC